MFRFSIRDLLLLTLLVGMGFGCWVNYHAMKQESRRLELENEYLKEELLELRFPNVQPEKSQAADVDTQTLEWLPPISN